MKRDEMEKALGKKGKGGAKEGDQTFYNIIMASVKVAVRVRPFNKR